MPDLLLLAPDFLLIIAGFLICRHTPLGRGVWDGAERLVYYVLFPALLFGSIVREPIAFGSMLPLAGSGLAIVGAGVALAYALALVPGVDARLHASGAQTAFRFNSYVGLAVAARIAGADGVAWTALLISLCVPLCNIAAVWPLARHGGHGYARELLRNPLILATASGLVFNLLGLRLPELLAGAMGRVGSAAVPLGLMAVGAGLQFGALREGPGLAGALLAIRHLALPALAIALVLGLDLPPAQQATLVAFAALPTASSAYVLATRMGGHGGYVAGLVTLSTLVAMAGLPLALLLLGLLR
ncbi:transporter [Rubrivivax gelatinosus]|uniref:Transporter n=1 Tax=Rubrivivax gelatinosus TaxID=28068 RepID=A0ABS1DN98_RUBGE|nr:AEC family transporter [Rubrivivax gelatinosus]MBK1612725.1 transporter [Rubrivivax gelatinosus]MBK1711459.1 transporter [Rubrivivax gelatinosus]